jgi:23S rRNA G2445 N2-methylase RlmL
MRAFAVTIEGFEDVAQQEVKELIDVDSSIEPSILLFETNKNDLAKLTYKTQSLKRTAELIAIIPVDLNLEITEKNIKEAFTSPDIKNKTFKVMTTRVGKHDFSSQNISRLIGSQIDAKVDMENPDIIIYCYIRGEKAYIGIDYAGIDLSKRDYKIYPHPAALNGAVAFSLLKLAGYDKTKVVLDPFCGASTIAIEAALKATNISPNFFRKDKLICSKNHNLETFDEQKSEKHEKIFSFDSSNHFVSTSKKNAKIANINKSISFSRMEIEWLDTKVDKESIDVIATHPPSPSKTVPEKEALVLYKEFIYQLKFILKPNAVVTIIAKETTLLESLATDYNIKKRTIKQGNQELSVLKITKK